MPSLVSIPERSLRSHPQPRRRLDEPLSSCLHPGGAKSKEYPPRLCFIKKRTNDRALALHVEVKGFFFTAHLRDGNRAEWRNGFLTAAPAASDCHRGQENMKGAAESVITSQAKQSRIFLFKSPESDLPSRDHPSGSGSRK